MSSKLNARGVGHYPDRQLPGCSFDSLDAGNGRVGYCTRGREGINLKPRLPRPCIKNAGWMNGVAPSPAYFRYAVLLLHHTHHEEPARSRNPSKLKEIGLTRKHYTPAFIFVGLRQASKPCRSFPTSSSGRNQRRSPRRGMIPRGAHRSFLSILPMPGRPD